MLRLTSSIGFRGSGIKRVAVLAGMLWVLSPGRASALELLCDSSFTNCRTQLINMINAETVEIDVGMWFMEDARYASAIINRLNAGVTVRILMDPRANVGHPVNAQVIDQLKNGGVPMRKRTASGI